jgi:hypothetical protein
LAKFGMSWSEYGLKKVSFNFATNLWVPGRLIGIKIVTGRCCLCDARAHDNPPSIVRRLPENRRRWLPDDERFVQEVLRRRIRLPHNSHVSIVGSAFSRIELFQN